MPAIIALPSAFAKAAASPFQPIVCHRTTIDLQERIREISFFRPLFGPERSVVNPGKPAIDGTRLRLDVPGEYYLRVNGSPMKLLVLDRDAGLTAAILSVFDFLVANKLYLGADGDLWTRDEDGYLRSFFLNDKPMMLSCGPTQYMFRRVVEKYFGLPTRVASSVGVYYRSNGTLARLTHNISEVYLPEYDKFVYMDLNAGFVTLGMDAMDLSEVVRSKWPVQMKRREDIAELGIPLHSQVAICSPSRRARELTAVVGASGRLAFSDELVGHRVVDGRERAHGLRAAVYSGVGYWGGRSTNVWSGTEFLDGHLQFASAHEDPELRQVAIDGMQAQVRAGGTVEVVSPATLRQRLEAGHAQRIAAAAWTGKLCS